jgi:5'-nucleotidase
MEKKVVLLTNDDGINSPGLYALYDAFSRKWKTYIVAPEWERSASSHAVTLHRPLRVRKVKNMVYSVDGTPSDCVHLAVNGLLRKKPDIIISGINLGENLGDDITYSGTVSAAFEGTLLGIPSIAISIEGRRNFCFEPAVIVAEKIASVVLEHGLPQDTFLNVNVPNVPDINQIKGIRITRKGKRVYKEQVVRRKDPRGKWYYWIGGDNTNNQIPLEGSDIEAIKEGYVSITPINVDLTNYNVMEGLKKLFRNLW